jgi:oxygen-independent coproporphyrinogen-3 oxidase
VASQKYRDVFVDALLEETEARAVYLKGEPVSTIYFGGGTPSLLTVSEINRILDKLSERFDVVRDPEITLEANPDDLPFEKIKMLKNETPVNRFSIGVQSFFDDDLKYLDRTHTAKDAREVLEDVIKAGFENITIDLIYGIPGLSEKKWYRNLEIFFSYDIPHLSSYSLTVEPKTALAYQIDKKKRTEPDEQLSVRHFEILMQETASHGFIHYEISNFAKEGYYSKHNSIYWLGDHYIGLGPSAHSFNGVSRQWNVASVKKYVESEKIDKIIAEKEVLTKDQRFNEYVMTSLRTSWGCDIEHILNVFGEPYARFFEKGISPFLAEKKVEKEGNRCILTETGKLFADGIAAELFYGI